VIACFQFHLFRENAENVPGANQSDEVGNTDAVRHFEILTVSLLFVWRMRSSLAASVRTDSSPARSACTSILGHVSFVLYLVDDCWHGCNQGTSRPSCRYSSSTAGYRSCWRTRRHRSRALPDAPQTKQRQMFRPRCAENDRLRDDDDPCTGHGPRTCSPLRWPTCQPSSCSTTLRRISARACRQSISGMLLPLTRNREEEPVKSSVRHLSP
jgi:hypothetical protein